MTNTKQILPEDGLVISREWLEKEIKEWTDYFERIGYKDGLELELIDTVLKHSTPLTPIVEDAWGNGSACGYIYGDDDKLLKLKSLYLSQPIKLENDGK